MITSEPEGGADEAAGSPESVADVQLEGRRRWYRRPRGIFACGGVIVAIVLVVSLFSGDTQWVQVSNPIANTGNMSTVSCSPAGCAILGESDLVLWLGRGDDSWKVQSPPASIQYSGNIAISCARDSCWETDGSGDLASIPTGVTEGSRSKAQPFGDWFSGGFSCAPEFQGLCVNLRDWDISSNGLGPRDPQVLDVYRTVFGTLNSLREPIDLKVGVPLTPDCVNNEVCFALGSPGGTGVWRTMDAGRTWTPQASTGAWNDTSAISCTSTSSCAVSRGSSVYFTTDAGRSWRKSVVSDFAREQEECVSADGSVGNCDDPRVYDQRATVNALTCLSAEWCLAGSQGNLNVSWFTTKKPSGLNYPEGGIEVTSNGGRTWTAESIPSNVAIDSIACESRHSCWAVGETSSVDNPQGVILRLAS